MTRKTIILLLVCIFSALTLSAQRFTSFSIDPSLTKEEVRTFASTVPKERQKEAEAFVAKFDAFWDSPAMTEEFQESFLETANLLLRKNLRFFPHFVAFQGAFDAFINSELTDNDKAWLKAIQYHLNNDLADFHHVMNDY
nr:hypothetical protein [Bacteroidales bacterium]